MSVTIQFFQRRTSAQKAFGKAENAIIEMRVKFQNRILHKTLKYAVNLVKIFA